MESQRVNGKPVNAPEVGEVVLVVGEEKNRSEWKKGRVVRQVKGKDGVVRGVVLLHKGHTIERPLQLVCPLEIRCTTQIEQRKNEEKQTVENERKKRGAAIEAYVSWQKTRMQTKQGTVNENSSHCVDL